MAYFEKRDCISSLVTWLQRYWKDSIADPSATNEDFYGTQDGTSQEHVACLPYSGSRPYMFASA